MEGLILSKKGINFMYSAGPYQKILDSIIEPIMLYLPDATRLRGYQEGKLNVRFFLAGPPKNVVFISHGMGDKGWRDGKAVKDFDYICVSGPDWKEKLIRQGVEENKILINGYTKLDPIFKNHIKKIHDDDKLHVLYAPTHNTDPENAGSISSYPRLIPFLDSIPEDMELIKSAHPYNNNGIITMDLLTWADVIISDCSSIIYEAFALDIPVVFPDWLIMDNIMRICPDTFTGKIYREGIGYHAKDIRQMWELTRTAASRGLNSYTREFIEGIFPEKLRGRSGETTAGILINLSEGRLS